MVATQTSVNLALASSSEYIKEQLGLPTRPSSSHHKRRGSWGGNEAPGTPHYKSQEEMYDEIIELKKVNYIFLLNFVP